MSENIVLMIFYVQADTGICKLKSFVGLIKVVNWLEQRLTGLALLPIHRERLVDKKVF